MSEDDEYLSTAADEMASSSPEEARIQADTEDLRKLAADHAALKASHAELKWCLEELLATVKGECPSLLNEDSGGSALLDMRIDDALAAAEAIAKGDK